MSLDEQPLPVSEGPAADTSPPPAPASAPVVSDGVRPAPQGALSKPSLLRLGMVGAAAAVLLWGTWVSKEIYALQHHANRIVKVRLSEVVADYVQTTARSGVPTEQAAQQTATFLKLLGDTVEAHRGKGQIVMLANAIVAGDIPDITEEIRTEVYGRIARPQAAQPGAVQAQMKQFMDANAASASETAHGQ
jgi:hypothetical protein